MRSSAQDLKLNEIALERAIEAYLMENNHPMMQAWMQLDKLKADYLLTVEKTTRLIEEEKQAQKKLFKAEHGYTSSSDYILNKQLVQTFLSQTQKLQKQLTGRETFKAEMEQIAPRAWMEERKKPSKSTWKRVWQTLWYGAFADQSQRSWNDTMDETEHEIQKLQRFLETDLEKLRTCQQSLSDLEKNHPRLSETELKDLKLNLSSLQQRVIAEKRKLSEKEHQFKTQFDSFWREAKNQVLDQLSEKEKKSFTKIMTHKRRSLDRTQVVSLPELPSSFSLTQLWGHQQMALYLQHERSDSLYGESDRDLRGNTFHTGGGFGGQAHETSYRGDSSHNNDHCQRHYDNDTQSNYNSGYSSSYDSGSSSYDSSSSSSSSSCSGFD